MNRRELLTRAGLGASAGLAGLLAPIKALGAEVKPIRIKNVETFNIEIPATPTEVEAGVTNRTAVVRVETESGVRGYSFGAAGGGGGRGAAAPGFALIREALVGADLFAMEQHLKRGLINWGGIEEALWDGDRQGRQSACIPVARRLDDQHSGLHYRCVARQYRSIAGTY